MTQFGWPYITREGNGFMNLIQKIALCVFVTLIACGGDKPTDPENGDNPTDSGLDAHRFDITENQTSDFGMNTPGGRGGRVIRVTNLLASGQGSLDAALSASGPRIVVFEVGGVIDLNKARLNIRETLCNCGRTNRTESGHYNHSRCAVDFDTRCHCATYSRATR